MIEKSQFTKLFPLQTFPLYGVSITESALTTGETPADELLTAGTSATDQMPSGMESSMSRYPSREHQPPSQYDNYIQL